jgi:hypothetical protein
MPDKWINRRGSEERVYGRVGSSNARDFGGELIAEQRVT